MGSPNGNHVYPSFKFSQKVSDYQIHLEEWIRQLGVLYDWELVIAPCKKERERLTGDDIDKLLRSNVANPNDNVLVEIEVEDEVEVEVEDEDEDEDEE